ncbi:MAG: plastocyanin/azurin family copper-binding protein [Pseudomonadota bacterium]
MNKKSLLSALFAIVILISLPSFVIAEPKVHTVEMITEGGKKLFVPDFLEVSVGDIVRFVNISGNHNTESIKGMIPQGAESWRSNISETFELTIQKEGVYAYKCTPHLQKRMVGVIVAGNPAINLREAHKVAMGAKFSPKVSNAFAELLERIKTPTQ